MMAARLVASPETSGYALGQALGALLILALGVMLLVKGIRMRSSRPAPAPAPMWTPPPPPPAPASAPAGDTPDWALPPVVVTPGYAAPPMAYPPQTSPAGGARSVVYIVIGSLLLLGSIASGARAFSERTPKRVILHPSSVLGLPLNEAASSAARDQLQATFPKQLTQSSTQVYGSTAALLVVAGIGPLHDLGSLLSSFRTGVTNASAVPATDVHSVNPGAMGGEAQCFGTGLQGRPVQVCAFADGGSLVAVIFFAGTVGDDPAQSALSIRNAVVAPE